MLTGKLVRVRHARDRLLPYYLDTDSETWLEVAEALLEIFRSKEGITRGEIEEEVEETFGNDPGQLVHQGLIKLLEDRCDFEVVSGHPPEELREAAFRAAALQRAAPVGQVSNLPSPVGQVSNLPSPVGQVSNLPPVDGKLETRPTTAPFDRGVVLKQVADSFGLTVAQVEAGLFADLRSEQRMNGFRDLSAKHLLQRYNVGLAQAVLLRSTRVTLAVRHEPPQRYRQLFRQIKFHRLLCEVKKSGPDSYLFHLDGPLSLFSATQKYGLQLALFLPTILLCKDFELKAELRWGPERKPKTFLLGPGDGLVSHAVDAGTYVPPEVGMFVELFRKRQPGWEISEETNIFPLGDSFWVPDFRLRHKESGKAVLLEVLGFWRRSSAETHLERLRRFVREPFLLAVSDQLHIEEANLEGLAAGIHRFRQMPLPDEIARLAQQALASENEKGPA